MANRNYTNTLKNKFKLLEKTTCPQLTNYLEVKTKIHSKY